MMGIDDESKSSVARFMHSNSIDPNIRWTKQRFGKQAGTMHFYTIDKVEVGDELSFDYGSSCWDDDAVERLKTNSTCGHKIVFPIPPNCLLTYCV